MRAKCPQPSRPSVRDREPPAVRIPVTIPVTNPPALACADLRQQSRTSLIYKGLQHRPFEHFRTPSDS